MQYEIKKMKVIFTFIAIAIACTNVWAVLALPLPDGSHVTIRDGETPAETWKRAQRMYPEAFPQYISEDKKYDVDYFNNCQLTATKDSKTEIALAFAIESCKHKATPKKCRAFKISKDKIGSEKGPERVQCVEECSKANYYSKTIGECSKG